MSKATKIILAVLAVIVALGIIGSLIDDDTEIGASRQATVQSAPASYPELDAQYLMSAYEENEVAADSLYKGQTIIISGQIDDIGKDILDAPYVMVGRGDGLFGVQCMFDKRHEGALGRLRKGMGVRIQGKVSGKLGSVLLRDCQLR